MSEIPMEAVDSSDPFYGGGGRSDDASLVQIDPEQQPDAEGKEDRVLSRVKNIRGRSRLDQIPVRAATRALQSAAEAAGGRLTEDAFRSAYLELLSQHTSSEHAKPPSEKIVKGLFGLFDKDGNGVVDMMEIVCGVALMAQGDDHDKLHAVFDAFDANKDGSISFDEMHRFLASVFRVVLTPSVKRVIESHAQLQNVQSADDLARETTEDAFRRAGVNRDGKLTIEEFKKWFYGPYAGPDETEIAGPLRALLK